LHSHRCPARPGRAFTRLPVHQRSNTQPPVRIGLEVVGSAGADRTAEHQRRALGANAPENGRLTGLGWRCSLPVPLDAAIWTGGPPAVVARRDGLRGGELREHGVDPQLRRGLRRLVLPRTAGE
jgi:hypothetical protein